MAPPANPSIPKFDRKTDADKFFLARALGERFQSDDPKARQVLQSGVGAIIVGQSGIISQSANVLPPRLKLHHEREHRSISEEERYFFIEHAERAAIMKALLECKSLEGATLYGTRFPCSDCARAIVWAGITRAVFATGYAGEARWLPSQRAAAHILRKAGVTVRVLSLSESPNR